MIWKRETEKSLVNKKLNIICAFFCLFVFLHTAQTCFAADGSNFINIYAGCDYDKQSGLYAYTLFGGSDIILYADILNGTSTNSNVKVSPVKGISYIVYKNGKEINLQDNGRLTEPGEYAISVYDSNGKQDVILKFTILSRFSNKDRMDLPVSCSFDKVICNGELIQTKVSYVEFDKEGFYEVTYRVDNTDKTYRVTVNIDKTPPVIVLEGLDENNQAYGPVKITSIEDKVAMAFYKDGKEMEFTKNFDMDGKYKVIVQDEAHNQTVYEFVIFPYYNISSILFIAFSILILVMIIMYVFFVRKNLRVR